MQLTLETVCFYIVVGYSILGWLVLTGVKINYGRLQNSLANIYFSPKFGWFFFEVPNLLWAAYFLFVLNDKLTLPYILFIVHYINRDIVYPWRMKSNTKVPLEILLSAFSFTFANGYLQGLASQQYESAPAWRTLMGVVLFIAGMGINIHSDNILQAAKQKLQKEGGKKYTRIDKFLFKWIANPNYLGEIVEWTGYALVSGHFYAWLFVFSTVNVLTPAAMVRSNWNKKNIENYPQQRKAIFPYLV